MLGARWAGTGIALLCGFLLMGSFPPGVAQRVGPQGRVRVLCIGDVNTGLRGSRYNSYFVITYDPAIELTFVPTGIVSLSGGEDEAVRNMRVYMPRTQESLLASYDMLMLSAANNRFFKPRWIHWMSDSIESGGMGLLMLGVVVYEDLNIDWVGTTLGPLLPVTVDRRKTLLHGVYWVRVTDRNESLMKALPWEKSPPLLQVSNHIPREGSHQWAVLDNDPRTHPLMTFWEVGKGAVLNFAAEFPDGPDLWERTWDVFPQAMMYLVYRVADKVLPRDPYIFMQVMNEFIEFDTMGSLVGSMLDWVEKFGGNPRKLRDELESVNGIRAEAEAAYLDGDFEEALEAMDRARAEHIRIREEATRAKDEALFWVYVTEWCALLGTLMVSSYVLWSLMVRRRLYREAGVSRLSSSDE